MLHAALTRGPFWVASFALHGAVFLAAGHAPRAAAPRATAAADDTLAIEVVPVPEPPVVPDLPLLAPVATAVRASPPPTHTHDYPVPPDHDAHPHDPSIVHAPFSPPPPPAPAPAPAPSPPAPPPASPAAVADEPVLTAPEPARFRLVVDSRGARPGAVALVGPGGATAVGSAAAGADPGTDADPLPEERATSPAVLIRRALPEYPPEARAQQIEADVLVEVVVGRSGDVVDARVIRSAGYGLDEAALRAARASRYLPARIDGRPVAVRHRWPISFRLR